MRGPESASDMLAPLAPHARNLFRGGFAVGFGAFAVYLLLGQTIGGEALDPSWGGRALAIVALLAALATVLGGLAMPSATAPVAPPAPEEAPAESFLRLAARAETWIERARRYILYGGLFAGVVWLPLMLFGLTGGKGGPAFVPLRILSIAGFVAFSAVAILWWRRVVEIDRELREWRTRVAKLRAIESELLAEP